VFPTRNEAMDKNNPNGELIGPGDRKSSHACSATSRHGEPIARTATKRALGRKKTPIAGIVHSLTLAGVVLFAAPLVKKCRDLTAAILMTVA